MCVRICNLKKIRNFMSKFIDKHSSCCSCYYGFIIDICINIMRCRGISISDTTKQQFWTSFPTNISSLLSSSHNIYFPPISPFPTNQQSDGPTDGDSLRPPRQVPKRRRFFVYTYTLYVPMRHLYTYNLLQSHLNAR